MYMAILVQTPESIIKIRQVQARTGVSRSGLYQKVADGNFPKPIKLGARASGWILSEVDAWVAERIAASRAIGGVK
jgi:prophage regulatory protein